MNKASEIISFWAHLKPTEIAFADESHEVSFRELDMYTRKIGFLLKEKGIKHGEVVGLIVPGYLGWLFSLSLFRLGVSTMVQNSLSAFSPELIPDWVIGLEQHPDISAERMIVVDEDYLVKVNASKELDVFEGFASPDDIATFFSTSGTTGETKYKAVGAQHIWAGLFRLGWKTVHGRLQQCFVAACPRAGDLLRQVAAIGCEGQTHRVRQALDGLRCHLRVQAHGSNDKGETGAAAGRGRWACVDRHWRGAVRPDARQRPGFGILHQPGIGRGGER
jgi:hypothetical protein